MVIGSYLLAFKLVATFTGTEGFGEYSLSRRTLSLLIPLVVLGADLGIARYVSYAETEGSGKSPGYAAASLTMLGAGVAALSIVLLVAAPLWAKLFYGSASYSGLVLVLPVLLAGSGLHSIAFGYLRGLNRVQLANTLLAVNMGLLPLAAILLVHGSVQWALMAMGLGWVVTSGLVLARLPIHLAAIGERLREMTRFGIPRVPGDFVSLLLFAMPGILVAQAADIRVAGIVAFGVAAVSMIGSSLTPVSFLLLPAAARLLAAGKVRQLRSEVIEVTAITLAGTLVVVVLLEVFAAPIVSLYLGPSFSPGVDVLRLTLIGALPWAAYITLRSVIDAHHVRPINARNLLISFLCALALGLVLRRVADPTIAAVLAFVLGLWILAALTLVEVNRIANVLGHPADRSPIGLARLAMLAALPVAIVVSSPQRPVVALLISLSYVVMALASLRLSRSNLLMLAYIAGVAVWMTVSWLRSTYLLHLDAAQLSYGTSKFEYFVFIVLPLAAAVAIIVKRVEDTWPIAGAQVAIGGVIALITVALVGAKILGADRYAWQGDLIALGTLIAVQPWLVKNVWAEGAIGVLGVGGIMFAGARQSLVAFAVALLLSAAYWSVSRYIRAGRAQDAGAPDPSAERADSAPTAQTVAPAGSRSWRTAVASRYVVLPLALLILTVGAIAFTYNRSPNTYCNCITDRLISLEQGAGDRDKMIYHAFGLLGQDPILGTGLGSFAGSVQMSLSPGNFYQYPHNVPLEVASETGLIGLLLIFAPLIAGWLFLLRDGIRRGSPAVAGLMMIVTVFFTVANLSGDIPSDRGLWVFGILAFKLGIDASGLRVASPSRAPAPIRTAPVSEARSRLGRLFATLLRADEPYH
ncbi:MAG TPA: O-antigen ligase family protein [Candidatus Dormibacteraeota bacterium]